MNIKPIILAFLILTFQAQAYQFRAYDGINKSYARGLLEPYEIPDYVISIVFINQTNRDYCGWAFLSGKIYMNLKNNCDFDYWFRHELRHAEHFRMDRTEAVNWCKDNNINWTRQCWEKYAEMEKWNTKIKKVI